MYYLIIYHPNKNLNLRNASSSLLMGSYFARFISPTFLWYSRNLKVFPCGWLRNIFASLCYGALYSLRNNLLLLSFVIRFVWSVLNWRRWRFYEKKSRVYPLQCEYAIIAYYLCLFVNQILKFKKVAVQNLIQRDFYHHIGFSRVSP
jgi:hypothetical protein